VFTVNGKPMSVSDLRPGMSGTATITTTTTVTPVTVTEVKSGTVALVSGTAVYVRTPEGVRLFTQSELDKRGVKIFVDGKPRAVSELHEGNRLTATIVTTKPPSIVTEKEVQATLAKTGAAPVSSAAPAPAPSAAQAGAPASPAQQPVATTARTLPSTAGSLPTVGLAGLVLLAIGAFATRRRRVR
jgi:LPXTG-motif cell wall-anchored protein